MDNGVDIEVCFKADDHEEEATDDHVTEVSAPPTPITHCDMDLIIRGWEEKFQKMLECLREVQMTSERASSDMCLVSQEARAQAQEHDRRLPSGNRQNSHHASCQRFEGEHAQNMPGIQIQHIACRTRRCFPPRAQHVAAHPGCAHRGSVRQHGDADGIRAQHVAAHRECAH